MYESDEWYVQYELDKDPKILNRNAKEGSGKALDETEDLWTFQSSVDDHGHRPEQ